MSTALAEPPSRADSRTTRAASTVTKAEYYYNYAGDDPINNIDPSGQLSCHSWGISAICHAVHNVGHFARKHKEEISCGLVAGATAVALLDPAVTLAEIGEIAAARAEAGAAEDAAAAAAGRAAVKKALTRTGAAGVVAGGGYIGGFNLGSGCLNYLPGS